MKIAKSCYIYIALILLPFFLYGDNFSTLEDEYTPKYCLQLEAAYGEGMMSEGGSEGVEFMFECIPLQGKAALDIGSGLGGVAFYLAEKYSMHVTGLEVNAWMVDEAKRRTPEFLKDNVNFVLSLSNSHWSMLSGTYDVIYSKGVLTHLEKKDETFQECHRLLKNGGLFVVTDWLSSDKKQWGKNITRLVQLEKLALFPESESGYIELLEQNGFTLLSVRDDGPTYLKYNREIVERLKNIHSSHFNESELEASIDGYASIAKAIEEGELRVLRFVAQKNDLTP